MASPYDPKRNLPTVRYQNLLEQGCLG